MNVNSSRRLPGKGGLFGLTKFPFFLLLLISFSRSPSIDAVFGQPLPRGQIDPDEAELSCGRRSLFVMLRLLHYEVKYNEVTAVVPVQDGGTTIEQLVESAKHWGCQLEPMRGALSDLLGGDFPVIAHVWLDQDKRSVGHYVVVLGVRMSKNVILFVDPSNGALGEFSPEEFNRFWSGYVIAPVSHYRFWGACLMSINTVLGAGLFGSLLRRAILARRIIPVCLLISSGMFASGCTDVSEVAAAKPEPKAFASDDVGLPVFSEPALRTSGRLRNLGVIKPGAEALAVFEITNVSMNPVTLLLGQPTCGCLGASITEDIAGPGKSIDLQLVLSNGEGAGGRQASVELGVAGSKERYVFSVKAMLEGMSIDPYAIRIPSNREGFEAEPINGEILFTSKALGDEVAIMEVKVAEGPDGVLRFKDPELFSVEQMPQFFRRRFRLPVVLDHTILPETGVWRVRLVYRVGASVGEHYTVVRMFPRAETPNSRE